MPINPRPVRPSASWPRWLRGCLAACLAAGLGACAAPAPEGPAADLGAADLAGGADLGGADLSGADLGGAGAPCAGLPLCDGFEGAAPGGPPDPALWQVVAPNCSGSGSVAIDGAVSHGGARSLRVTGKGGYCNHVFVAHSAALRTLGKAFYGRFYLRLGAALGQDHVTFLAMRDGNDNNKDLRMGGQSQILMWNRESDDATLPELSPAGIALSVKPAAQGWRCVELFVDGDRGQLRTWVDGAEVPGLIMDGIETPDVDRQWLRRAGWRPAPTDLRLGWESYGGAEMSLWIDDVTLGPSRIGC